MAKKDTSCCNEKFKTTIGGQALIEGIMMRGPEKDAIVDMFDKYKGILLFAVENHKFIGEIIKKKEKGEFDAVAKMKVMYAQKKAQEARRKMSDKKKKRITIKYLVNGKNREFIGREDMAKELGVSLATVKKMLSDEKYCISKGFKVIDRQ